jgi:squalene synthase HpnC
MFFSPRSFAALRMTNGRLRLRTKMPPSSRMFLHDLDRFGPAATSPPLTLDESRRYCRRLAERHYENFTVASRLLPRRLRQHVCNIYAYCRWADDLADETGDPNRSLALLDWWEKLLRQCYLGETTHPVFIALAETVREFDIPVEPFLDLLVAFRQDQRVTRYKTLDELLEYCRYSANPVGRMVLYLGQCQTPERARLSDSICTGLQLANFWQDVARDWDRGRVYLPQADCRQFGYDEAHFARRECNAAFRQLLAVRVADAESRLRAGLPLAMEMPNGLRLPVALFAAGGLATLEAIRRQQFDVWTRRPTVSQSQKLRLLLGCWWNLRFRGGSLAK